MFGCVNLRHGVSPITCIKAIFVLHIEEEEEICEEYEGGKYEEREMKRKLQYCLYTFSQIIIK